MYTEEEVLSGSVRSSEGMTKMKVRVPEQERKRLMEVKSQAKVHRLTDFLHSINANKSNYINERNRMNHYGG